MSQSPIGIFDSGVGGLSVAREIRALLPMERLLYLADTAYCPYGGRPLEQIRERSLAVARELERRGAKLIVVACNTASGAALETLRASLDLPVVGLEPAVKPAAARSRTRRVGVMATVATLQTERFDRLMRNFARDVEVVPQACPGLVELVESGETEGDSVEHALRELVDPMLAAGVDSIVLGCTHYPFLRRSIAAVAGPEVEILDSGAAVARQVERVLRDTNALAGTGAGGIQFLTTGDPDSVGRVVARLWDAEVEVEAVVGTLAAGTGDAQPSGQLRSSGAPPPGGSTR